MCRPRAQSLMVGLAAVFMVVLAGIVGTRASAQDASSIATSDHPMVGTWFIGLPGDPPGRGPTLATYFGDGNVLVFAAAGPSPVTWMGIWSPTGPTTIAFTIVAVNVDESGAFTGNTILDGANELDATGNQFTTTGTITMRDAAGQVTNSFPIAAVGSRVTAALSSTSPAGPDATPAATPTS